MIFRKRRDHEEPELDSVITDEPQYPHCDTRVLHKPGDCEYCDRHPEWQLLRKRWGIAFTGEQPLAGQLPCPADFNRPPDSPSDHRRWYGNVAKKD